MNNVRTVRRYRSTIEGRKKRLNKVLSRRCITLRKINPSFAFSLSFPFPPGLLLPLPSGQLYSRLRVTCRLPGPACVLQQQCSRVYECTATACPITRAPSKESPGRDALEVEDVGSNNLFRRRVEDCTRSAKKDGRKSVGRQRESEGEKEKDVFSACACACVCVE